MLRKLQQMRQNPTLLLRYVLNNPKTVVMVLAGLAAVVVVVVLSFSVEVIPTWIGLLGLAVLPGYAAWLQWGRLSLLVRASEVPAGRVSPGVVEVSGTARAADEDVVVSKSTQLPYLVLSDRSGIGLLGRQLGYFVVAGVATLALVGAAVLGIVGLPVV